MTLSIQVTRLHALELFYHLQQLGTVLLVSVGNHHFLSLIIVKAAIVVLMDDLVLIHFLKTIECWLVVHYTDGIGKEIRQMIRGRFIIIIVDDLKGNGQVSETSKCLLCLSRNSTHSHSEFENVFQGNPS